MFGAYARKNNLLVRFNQISDISPLSELINLTYLNLSSNQILDLSPILGLINMTDLSLTHNDQINNIIPLIDNSGLASGDRVWLEGDDLIPSSQIDDLRAKGVTVYWP